MAIYTDTIQTLFDGRPEPLLKGLDAIMFKLGYLSVHTQKVFGNMTKLATRSMTSISDAVEASFPANREIGFGAMTGAAEKAIVEMERLAAIEPLDLKGFGIDQVLPALSKTEASFRNVDELVKDTTQSLGFFEDKGRSIQVLMGLLFGGMALQRWGQVIGRFVLPQMDKIENYTSKGTKQVNAMKASFEFLKFSIFETFTSTPMFRWFVDLIITGSNWLSKFVSKYPLVTQIAGALAGIFGVGGALLTFIGTPLQLVMLWKALFGAKSATDAVTGIEKVSKSWGSFADKLGVGLAVGVIGFSIADAVVNFKEGDWGGVVGDAIAAGLGIAGAASFLLGAGPLGWVLTIFGAVTLIATKLTTDTRRITAASKDALGISKENPFMSWFEAMYKGPDEGMQKAAFGKVLKDFEILYLEQEQLRKKFDTIDVADYSSRIDANNELLRVEKDLSLAREALYKIDPANANEALNSIKFQIDAYAESQNAIEQKSQMESNMLNETIPLYAEQVSEIAQSKEQTALFMANMDDLLGIMTGPLMDATLHNLFMMDVTFVSADRHFVEFRDKLEAWASKVTTKTVEIRYTESNKPSGTGGFLSSVGGAVSRFVSSVTGG